MNEQATIHAIKCVRNHYKNTSRYVTASRRCRAFELTGAPIPAEMLLEVQLANSDFKAHLLNHELFAPTFGQSMLKHELGRCETLLELQIAVQRYLIAYAPATLT